MIQSIELSEGVTLRLFRDNRFKQGCLSLQFVRPMSRQEAALNALLPNVLLRGTAKTPDLRSITLRLDDLYGASVGPIARRAGDYQLSGLFCGFIEDKYALNGDAVFDPMIAFLKEILFMPRLEKGAFLEAVVESEKKNLIATIESRLNDKRAYAADMLMRHMCSTDSYGIPRLGEKADVAAITPQSLYTHYEKLLRESKVELFYVGSASAEMVADELRDLFADRERKIAPLPAQTGFSDEGGGQFEETMAVSQGKLAIGYYSPITQRSEQYAAMHLCSAVLGGGMTGKLFVKVREQMSLCYDIGAVYYSSKGILTVSTGIDSHMKDVVEQQVEEQIAAICRGEITETEMESARQLLLSALSGVNDTPGNIEGYYAVQALTGGLLSREEYMEAVAACTAQEVAEAAKTLKKHTVFFLKGVAQ